MKFKNEAIVGLIVLAAIAVLVFSAFWLSGRPWAEEQRDITAIFLQVGQLRPGNPVVFRGVTVGRVSEITLAPGGGGVYVNMEVDPNVDAPLNSAVVLAPQSLFGDWQAQIVPQGSFPSLEFTTTTARPNVLPGATLPDISELTAVAARIAADIETLSERVELAFTEETAIKIRQTVDNVQEISAQLTGFVEDQTETFDAVAENALAASQNVQETTAQVELLATRVQQTIDEGELAAIINNVQQATQNLQQLTAQLDTVTAGVPAVLAQLDTTLTSVNRVLTQVEPAAAELGPTLVEARQALATLQTVGNQIQQGEGTLGRLLADPALYEETQRSIATLRRILADLQDNPGKYLQGVVEVF